MPAVVCLLLALQWGGSKYEWSNARIIVLFVLFGVMITTFIAIQYWKKDMATVPPRILGNRSIASGSFYAFCLGSAFFILVYYLPIWFQAVEGVSAVESGIRCLPLILGLVLVSIISGLCVSLEGHYAPWMIASSIAMAIGSGLITTFKPDTGSATWIGFQVLAGVGVGLGMQQPLIAVQTALPLKDVPTGTAVLIFLQTLGGALFVSIGQNVFTNKLTQGLAEYAPQLDPAIILSTGATSIQYTDPKYLAGVTLAYNNALTTAFTVSAAMASISILGSASIPWLSVKGKKIDMAVA